MSLKGAPVATPAWPQGRYLDTSENYRVLLVVGYIAAPNI